MYDCYLANQVVFRNIVRWRFETVCLTSKLPVTKPATNMRKTLILPAEIHSREFDARLLHGIVAAQHGWRVITGSKALINRAIWRMPRGVYLCQTMTHKRVIVLRMLKSLGFAAFGWDEEGLIYFSRDIYLMRRISVDTLAMLQSMVTWGKQAAEDVEERAKSVGLTPLPLGNPRFDLVRPELKGLYDKEVAAIRARYGRFVLINTNFSSFNAVISLHDLKPRTTSEKHAPTETEKAGFAKGLAHRREVYDRFLADLPSFTAQHRDTTFVLRAHPGENEGTWRKVFAGQANVHVIREGSSIPWLIATDALIHNNCTTAVEAAIAGLVPICYCPVVSLEDESTLPNPISYRVYDFAEMTDAIRQSTAKTLRMHPEQRAILGHHVSAIDGALAAQRVMTHLDSLTLPNSNPLKRAGTLAFGAIRQLFKSLRRDHITDRYLDKVFPTLRTEDVEARANQIANALNEPRKIAINQITRNVFELEFRR